MSLAVIVGIPLDLPAVSNQFDLAYAVSKENQYSDCQICPLMLYDSESLFGANLIEVPYERLGIEEITRIRTPQGVNGDG